MAATTRLMTFAAFLLLTVAPSLSTAAFTYTYIGEDYSGDTNGAFLTTPASPPRVSGSFTVATPLPPSTDIQLVSSQDLLSFSFNNGLETIDSNSSNVGIYMFSVSTNDQGGIISSVIQIQQWLSQPGVGNLLNDIEITNGNNRTYHHVGCTQINSNACTGINFITTGPDPSSYAVWTSGTWYSPLQVKVGQNPLYATTSTILTVSGGNGSSGAVTYHLVSGPCTLSGNLLAGTGAGDCIVTATQAADGSHSPETSEPTTVNVIQPPPLQVNIDPIPLYVSSSTTLTVSGGNGSSGTVTYQLVSGPCTLSGNLLTGTGTGECVVTATQGADSLHLQETSAPTSVSVTQPPPLQVNAGQNPLPVSFSTTLTVSGGNGSTGTVTYQLVSGPCTLNADVITGTDLGDCVVKATQAADSLHPQMTSAPATITVSLTPQSTLYVSANPSSIGPSQTTSLTTSGGSGTGAVSYQLLSGPCTLIGSVLSGTSVGSCMVTATKVGTGSYASITATPLAVAVSLTPQIWSTPPSNLSPPSVEFDPNSTQLALSSDGTRAAAVWWVYDGTHTKVQFSSAIINGNVAEWIDPVDISPPGMDAGYPQIALSADGSRVIAVWQLYGGSYNVIQSAVASLTGNQAIWSIPVTLTASGLDSELPQVALSADGAKSIAIWQIYDGTHSVVQSSTATISGVTATWSSAANVSSPDTDSWNPQVLLAEDGSLSTAIWMHRDGGNTIIQSASASLSGTSASWGTIANLSATGSDADEPNFSLSGDGTKALSMWQQFDGTNKIVQSSAGTINGNTGTWGAPIDLSQPSLNTYSSQVTISEDGEKGVAIWSRSDTNFDLVESSTVSLAENGTSWSSPTILSQENHNSYLPKIAISQDGTKATAIWMDNFGDIYSIQSTSASIIENRANWGDAGNVSPTNESFNIYPKLKLSRDGTKATAIWNVFTIGGFYHQSSSATILYPAMSPSSQSVTGSIGVAIPPTAAFSTQGLYGTISYSVSPALPTGLSLNSATGVISGISYSALAPTTYIITGIGSMGGTASAEVTLEIPEGPPLVTNLVATPGPGPSIILTFNLQTASISSWLKSNTAVTYTGTCTSSDGGVTATGTGLGSPISVPGVTAGKIYSCVVTGSDGSGSSTSPPSNAVVPVPSPPPNPIPTLSDYSKIILSLAILAIAAWSRRIYSS